MPPPGYSEGYIPATLPIMIPVILGLSILTGLIGSAYTLHRQGTGQISLQDKSPLGWGIPSCILGSGAIIYSAFMMFPAVYFGFLYSIIPLLITGIVTLALGIRTIVLYGEMQDKHKYGLAPNQHPALTYGLALGSTSHFTIRF